MDDRFSEIVSSEAQFRAVIGHPIDLVVRKHIHALDRFCRVFIERSPFLLLASADGEGRMDVSPKGDPAGFVQVLDEHTLVIPDRPGNRRADTFCNLLANPNVALIFLVPGKQETLRVSGRACIVRDAWIRERMAVQGKVPEFAIVVKVEEAFFHCAKCVVRSKLWDPLAWPGTAGLPTLAEASLAHAKLDCSVHEVQAVIDEGLRNRLY
ncbi:MAG TPA: pyridoxamine 5'-phosphate oxidase family protein [Burkholderiaceae bacterium]|nr:pyridoxamine 5'-phosphate oxidase family protein [Burkholderiaceae bacterium]